MKRAIGYTRNLVDNLPNERCMIVVSVAGIGREIKNLIISSRGKDYSNKIKIITVNSKDDLSKMMGYDNLVFFDNSFFTLEDVELIKEAYELAHGASIIYHHKKGNLK